MGRPPLRDNFLYRAKSSTFLEGVVAFPAVVAGNEREVLLAVANQLSVELGYAEGGEGSYGESTWLGGGEAPGLNAEDELLVSRMRRALANVAAAASGGGPGSVAESAVRAALDGIEAVLRGELASGNADQLSELLPSFVFLVTLPVVHQDRALALSRRVERLIERRLPEDHPVFDKRPE
jgi:hypothetical protein